MHPRTSATSARPRALLAAAVIGLALYPVALRLPHPPALAGDAVHGAWVGVCVGLALVALGLMRHRGAPPRR